MADFGDDTLDLTEDQIADEADEQEQGEQSETETEESAEDEDELVFEDEAAPASGEVETGLAKHLRDEIKRRDREIAELRKSAPQQQAIEVGEKPTLANCEYDEEVYERQLDTWKARKAKADAQAREATESQQKSAEAWNQELQGHHSKKAALKFRDVQEAEDVATATLSEVQQAVIVKAADNSALIVYALGKSPTKLAEISKITDPIKLAAAIVKMEGKLKVTKRGGPPEPERIARGGAPTAGAKDKELERLEKEADRTGDSSALIAYRAKKKSQAK